MRQHSGVEQMMDFLMIFKLLAQAEEPRLLSIAGFVPCLDDRAGERIKRAYQHVFQHVAGRLNYKEIAKETGMSLSAFCPYFKRVTGRTLSDFVSRIE